jgi:hypothetical protein
LEGRTLEHLNPAFRELLTATAARQACAELPTIIDAAEIGAAGNFKRDYLPRYSL